MSITSFLLSSVMVMTSPAVPSAPSDFFFSSAQRSRVTVPQTLLSLQIDDDFIEDENEEEGTTEVVEDDMVKTVENYIFFQESGVFGAVQVMELKPKAVLMPWFVGGLAKEALKAIKETSEDDAKVEILEHEESRFGQRPVHTLWVRTTTSEAELVSLMALIGGKEEVITLIVFGDGTDSTVKDDMKAIFDSLVYDSKTVQAYKKHPLKN